MKRGKRKRGMGRKEEEKKRRKGGKDEERKVGEMKGGNGLK